MEEQEIEQKSALECNGILEVEAGLPKKSATSVIRGVTIALGVIRAKQVLGKVNGGSVNLAPNCFFSSLCVRTRKEHGMRK
ncbi:unnamed protein product [Sphenostylis stenocarpa]|uniref:Uncharacterized protein n=1 Tax=Sphenostylis stenocarpa TaxID=92480 RepID=A0AA86VUR1_9FABA|nr:unnamed protein product [Sphenostylis stenocarpa]